MKTYTQLKALLTEHYTLKPIMIAEHYTFLTTCQGENETVADYIVRLKELTSTCSFEAFLNEDLRKKLASRLHPKMPRTQTNLLSKADLSFEEARVKCLSDELASKANREHMGQTSSDANSDGAAEANQVQQGKRSFVQDGRKIGVRNKPAAGVWCKCCGRTNHSTENCRLRNVNCHTCYEKGHISKLCPGNNNQHDQRQKKLG